MEHTHEDITNTVEEVKIVEAVKKVREDFYPYDDVKYFIYLKGLGNGLEWLHGSECEKSIFSKLDDAGLLEPRN